jgi:spermidine synthase
MKKAMNDSETSLSTAFAGITVFFSSSCLMALELVAGRLMAVDIGSSLYTWTAVIGVVLAGMTIGNYAGGRIADKFTGKKLIAGLFGISSIICVCTIVVENRISSWNSFMLPSWPIHVLTCAVAMFLLPSVFLGIITPVVAKAALYRRDQTGRTIGNIYAFGAAGSIAGTFLAGFWLISAVGTIAVIWLIAAGLLTAGLIYSPGYRPLKLWAAILALLIFLGLAHFQWVEQTGAFLSLRSKPDQNVIYDDETQYCRIRIKQDPHIPDKRTFVQDRLVHSIAMMNDINNLQYGYERIYTIVTEQTLREEKNTAFLAIGGGGYIFPRFIRHKWPAGRVDVAEIDPGVTTAAMAAFGLSKNHGLNIFTMDGRNYVDKLLNQNKTGQGTTQFDFIYVDAYDNFSIPYQLVTREFNEKIYHLLKNDGVYMLNLIDVYSSALVLGSVINTLQQTFKNVYAITNEFEYYNRATFVLLASRQPLDMETITGQLEKYPGKSWCMTPAEAEILRNKCGRLILTDDYAPLDNLCAPIARNFALSMAAFAHVTKAKELKKMGRPNDCVTEYLTAVRVFPAIPISTYLAISEDLMSLHEFEEATEVCAKALEYYDKPGVTSDISTIYLGIGTALKARGQNDQARKYIDKAIEKYTHQLNNGIRTIDALLGLGTAAAATGNFTDSAAYLERAVKLDPSNPQYRIILAETLIAQKNYAGAKAAVKEAIDYMKQTGNEQAVAQFNRLLDKISYESSQPQQ